MEFCLTISMFLRHRPGGHLARATGRRERCHPREGMGNALDRGVIPAVRPLSRPVSRGYVEDRLHL
jgi:hypothetical protein